MLTKFERLPCIIIYEKNKLVVMELTCSSSLQLPGPNCFSEVPGSGPLKMQFVQLCLDTLAYWLPSLVTNIMCTHTCPVNHLNTSFFID